MADVDKNIICFLPICAVILHLALCRKHILKMPFLRLTFLATHMPKTAKFKNVKFDTKIKKRIRTRYCFVSTNTFRNTSIHFVWFVCPILHVCFLLFLVFFLLKTFISKTASLRYVYDKVPSAKWPHKPGENNMLLSNSAI